MWHLTPNGPSPSQDGPSFGYPYRLQHPVLPSAQRPRVAKLEKPSPVAVSFSKTSPPEDMQQWTGFKTARTSVAIEPDRSAATTWIFVHTTKEINHDAHEDMFAIAAGEPPLMGTLDFWGQQRIVVSSKRFWPGDWYHMWKGFPRDGAFTFKNFATGRLLSQARGAELVGTDPLTAFAKPSCQWRVVDASSGETCRVLYDSMLSVLPPELSGPPSEQAKVQESTRRLTLRTGRASPEVARRFVDELESQHDLTREMLGTGYASLVVAPLKIIGWRRGRISRMKIMDEESSFGLPKIRAAAAGFECT